MEYPEAKIKKEIESTSSFSAFSSFLRKQESSMKFSYSSPSKMQQGLPGMQKG
jgi:hypothetical protein